MNGISWIWHILNFFAPSVFMGVLLPTVVVLWRSLRKKKTTNMVGIPTTVQMLFATIYKTISVATLTLVLGFLVFQVDGHMGTYFMLIVACAICQLPLLR